MSSRSESASAGEVRIEVTLEVTVETGTDDPLEGIRVGGVLNESGLAQRIGERLPISGEVHAFGGELALRLEGFELSGADETAAVEKGGSDGGEVDAGSGQRSNPEPTNEVSLGTLAYWAPGNSLNLYCGVTPLTSTRGNDAVQPLIATSEVRVVGQLEWGSTSFEPKSVKSISIRRV